MLQQEKELRERLKETDLPEEIREQIERQHRALDLEMKAYAKRGRISYLELRSLEIEPVIRPVTRLLLRSAEKFVQWAYRLLEKFRLS